MCDRGNERPLLRANLEYLHHERNVVILFKPIRYRVLEHRRREGPEGFAPLDLGIEDGLNVRATRIAHDRSIAERPRAPFHAPLEPADNLAIGDGGRSPTAQPSLIFDDLNGAVRCIDLALAGREQRVSLG